MKAKGIKTLVWFDGQLILVRVPIGDIMEEQRFASAALTADCACHMASARNDGLRWVMSA